MATSKWIKGLIFIVGGLVLSTIITLFASGGHPTSNDMQLLLSAVITAIGGYIAKPPQTEPDNWGSMNWKDFWHGLLVTAGAAIGPLLLFIIKSFPKTMAEWWVVIGILVSYFGQYLLKALFTNSNGTVSITNNN